MIVPSGLPVKNSFKGLQWLRRPLKFSATMPVICGGSQCSWTDKRKHFSSGKKQRVINYAVIKPIGDPRILVQTWFQRKRRVMLPSWGITFFLVFLSASIGTRSADICTARWERILTRQNDGDTELKTSFSRNKGIIALKQWMETQGVSKSHTKQVTTGSSDEVTTKGSVGFTIFGVELQSELQYKHNWFINEMDSSTTTDMSQSQKGGSDTLSEYTTITDNVSIPSRRTYAVEQGMIRCDGNKAVIHTDILRVFDVNELKGDFVYIRSLANQKIVSVADEGRRPLVASRETAQDWELFRMHYVPSRIGQFYFVSGCDGCEPYEQAPRDYGCVWLESVVQSFFLTFAPANVISPISANSKIVDLTHRQLENKEYECHHVFTLQSKGNGKYLCVDDENRLVARCLPHQTNKLAYFAKRNCSGHACHLIMVYNYDVTKHNGNSWLFGDNVRYLANDMAYGGVIVAENALIPNGFLDGLKRTLKYWKKPAPSLQFSIHHEKILYDEQRHYQSLRSIGTDSYVSNENAAIAPLKANRKNVEREELYLVFHNGDGTISLKSKANGKFVCAICGGSLSARSDAIGNQEKFRTENHGEFITLPVIALKANANGKYVSAGRNNDATLVANQNGVGKWEKFYFSDV
ncbi:FRG1-like domain-containing protein [Ditylenchus destructor]|uniref:FRG1-like domain-containing protein n=1 Tax=Ditylenchus destructor TaxID=166010 RepID=A0AAD4QWZ3_9BILA|nr:FRG1-like domain-containing protein [Ditylenchus destructor]